MSRAKRYRDYQRRGAYRRGRSLFGQEIGYDASTEAVDPFDDPTVEKSPWPGKLEPLPDRATRLQRRIRDFALHLAAVIALCPLPEVEKLLWEAARRTPGYSEVIRSAPRGEMWKVAHENLSRFLSR